ncbi:hypothetical protein [Gloeothece verrucosa]|uniref:Uncharacterized protein n=1 Tax=Gloeothece verrucosa (strain PCC 7822) TaxID=497965 RepID=E0UAK7_GLOV7|nr:hypothetical protein [Gloeothece verrucosa]ADN12748.1 conserved hypothetical protein [Gloeothece verrucosa PCC 7822]
MNVKSSEQQKTVQKTKFYQALLESGLVKQIKNPTYDEPTKRKLLEVQGKPVSETIIEERR